MARIVDVELRKTTVLLAFQTEADAAEFARLARISADVDAELLLYGDGVLRTAARKRKK